MADKDELSKLALEAVEIARKTGKIKKGVNEATKLIEKGIAKLVVIAEDVNPKELTLHFPPLCKEKNSPLVITPKKEELGLAAGLSVSTSAVAIVNEGEAKPQIKKIQELIKST